jgi:hypothetical protein
LLHGALRSGARFALCCAGFSKPTRLLGDGERAFNSVERCSEGVNLAFGMGENASAIARGDVRPELFKLIKVVGNDWGRGAR